MQTIKHSSEAANEEIGAVLLAHEGHMRIYAPLFLCLWWCFVEPEIRERAEMKVQEIAITKLKPYENNPRINDRAVDAVAASIKEFGFKVPIVCDEDFVILGGAHKA